MNKENILVLEMFPNEKKTEVIDGKKFYGMHVYRIIQRVNDEYIDIAKYDIDSQSTDLHNLSDKVGYFLCSVEKNQYDKFFWMKRILTDYHEENKNQYIEMSNPEYCTEEEIELLNSEYPEYFDNAY